MNAVGHEHTPAILVMAKPPRPGTVKTRPHPLLGPALDGRYYLIGLRVPHTSLFALGPDVWSTDRVLAATRALARGEGLSVGLLRPLRDLDTPEDAAALLTDPALPASIAALLQPVEAP
ncbi:hypothetical protein [Streptomyces sp. H27-C3]|uniref:hypothetical protein n=1 Tax=Streptomyces sp. H27-C3 TaxID=3046305 RepID=UPI0024BA34B3|nr:hypothetical protein [Streptomyces sp. H27-C3]MDJ0463857.1 hypothetical protein [Streptomyces sp. H27-C3]